MARGGPQRIPRPESARPGGPPPWAHLAPEHRRVDLGLLAQRLSGRPARRRPGDIALPPHTGASAVLVALYDDGEPHVVLTRRSAALRSHTSEVSFPGGRSEAGETPWDTARREAYEEVGLDPAAVSPIGALDSFVTVGSRSLVHPVVGVLGGPPHLRAAPAEVEQILQVPLSELLLDEVFREERWPIAGTERPITFFELHGDTVWGATAAMLRQLLAVATGTDDGLTR